MAESAAGGGGAAGAGDAEVRSSRTSLSKSEKAREAGVGGDADGASEKLLQKEAEAKIVTRVDMTGPDAKYVAGEHRNGDAKIDIDATKKKFTGLTKEELMKYADDPFWVRLRYFMFILFWAIWLLMLVGAVAIIVTAPKCAVQESKKWFEKGPLVDLSDAASFAELEEKLPLLQQASVQGVYVSASLAGGDLYDEKLDLEEFKTLATKAKEASIKLIVEVTTANFVSKSHEWFVKSEASEEPYADYFVWVAAPKRFYIDGKQMSPNNWVSTLNEPAWSWSERRQAFYLHQHAAGTADLNFRNPRVATQLDHALMRWMQAGASGVRLHNARQLLVDASFANDTLSPVKSSAVFTDYAYYSHKRTRDQPGLAALLTELRAAVLGTGGQDALFSVSEPVPFKEPFLSKDNVTQLVVSLPSTGPLPLTAEPSQLVADLTKRLPHWPAIQFDCGAGGTLCKEAGLMSLLLPATPVLTWDQITTVVNDTEQVDSEYARVVKLRELPTVLNGQTEVTTLANKTLLAYTRWQSTGPGYLVLWNPSANEPRRADLDQLGHVPDSLTPLHFSRNYREPNITKNVVIASRDVVVSPQSLLVLMFVPGAEK